MIDIPFLLKDSEKELVKGRLFLVLFRLSIVNIGTVLRLSNEALKAWKYL